jgi:hypothetical protein
LDKLHRVVDFATEFQVESLIVTVDGVTMSIHRGPARAPIADPCLAAIVSTLRAAGRRLTTLQLLAAMDAAGHQFSERTVSGRLSQAVRDGLITTDRSGYGIPP